MRDYFLFLFLSFFSLIYSMTKLMVIMERNNLSVISPGIQRASMTSTVYYMVDPWAPNGIGHHVRAVEVFATVFTLDAWSCWWDMMQPRVNPAGWGYDLCYVSICQAKGMNISLGVAHLLGILMAIHHKEFGRVHVNTTGLVDQPIFAQVQPSHPSNI
jgi:hypothetical protein